MFTKASLVLIVALLVAILVNQRSQQVVQAQGPIEYKVVDLLNTQRMTTRGAQNALDDYGKAGWQLVTQYYFPNSMSERLIFMRK